ncbi:LapA family protein [Saccharopolyspora oryzae]|uniref:LapA family protein n=1 Tax=Saccharopolyspora oryzae TaxID=2997343 RepID=A0ABT4V890_9PSEU|nr:LapA family protein [Saccharopolyspora oryzae]MDA3629626.1 LapA family protein [Saccharopolyspora oryzae]
MVENGADKDEGVGGAGTRADEERLARTRTGGIWVSVVVAVVVLVFLLVFIVQNSDSVTVHFLWMAGNLPLGVAMIFAVLAGALLVALVGTARILQLRRSAKHRARRTK